MITGPATLLMWHSAMAVARTGKEDVTGANRLPHYYNLPISSIIFGITS
jgi:hypothetical protein